MFPDLIRDRKETGGNSFKLWDLRLFFHYSVW